VQLPSIVPSGWFVQHEPTMQSLLILQGPHQQILPTHSPILLSLTGQSASVWQQTEYPALQFGAVPPYVASHFFVSQQLIHFPALGEAEQQSAIESHPQKLLATWHWMLLSVQEELIAICKHFGLCA
jgi:hypothetical protein